MNQKKRQVIQVPRDLVRLTTAAANPRTGKSNGTAKSNASCEQRQEEIPAVVQTRRTPLVKENDGGCWTPIVEIDATVCPLPRGDKRSRAGGPNVGMIGGRSRRRRRRHMDTIRDDDHQNGVREYHKPKEPNCQLHPMTRVFRFCLACSRGRIELGKQCLMSYKNPNDSARAT